MPNVLDLRRRIRTIRNTQQITRAMKMVAAARLRRAQEAVMSRRPYSDRMLSVLRSVAARVEQPSHPLLVERPVQRILLVLVTSDRGLCGAFNSNAIRAAQYYRAHHGEQISLLAVGRKGRDFFRRHKVAMVSEHVDWFLRPVQWAHARSLANEIAALYADESVDAVDFIYNEFKSMLSQRVRVERILPVKAVIRGSAAVAAQEPPRVDYIYEEPPAELFRTLLPRYVESQVYRALVESQAAELAARMTAMDAATNNAGELIDTLTLNLNRARQAAITKEIIEIVSGAAAQ